MKKLIIFLVFASLCIVSFAQSTMLTLSEQNITESKWNFAPSVGLQDSIGVKQDSVSVPIYINVIDSLNPEIRVKLTEIISPARVILQFQVRRSTNDSWTTVTAQSKLYTGVGTDTTMYIRNVTGYHAWPYQRLLFITNSATKVGAYISQLYGFYKR
jgi:hypothetical protein